LASAGKTRRNGSLRSTRRTGRAQAPECRPPPIQGRQILRPARFFDSLYLEVDMIRNRAPPGVARLIWSWLTHKPEQPLLADATRREVLLCIDQRGLIRAASPGWPAQLHVIVFPEADRADLIRARRLAERQVTTARARIRLLHLKHPSSSGQPQADYPPRQARSRAAPRSATPPATPRRAPTIPARLGMLSTMIRTDLDGFTSAERPAAPARGKSGLGLTGLTDPGPWTLASGPACRLDRSTLPP